jgi:hypothetical protein
MATNFPGSLDSFTNPSASDAMDSVTVPHATQHANLNDAVEALQSKVGVDGSAVTTSLDYKVANQGLTFIKSVTVGSGVSSVTVSNAFDSRFDNYRVIMSGGTSTNLHDVGVQIGSSTTGYYGVLLYGSVGAGSPSIASRSNHTSLSWVGGGDAVTTSATFELFNPYQAMYTTIRNGCYQANGYGVMNGEHRVSSSYTGFTLLISNGTITGGTIRVYGFNNG